MIYDLGIIGGGPAGVAAGVYAARKRLHTIFIAEVIGGQSTDSLEVQNWIGTPKISGVDLAKALEEHVRAYADDVLDIHKGERVTSIKEVPGGFEVHTQNATYTARALLITTGAARRKLTIPGAEQFENKGVTYCASCDGPLFAGQNVVVVGGGNAGFESAAQLLAYCKSVTLIHKHSDFAKADQRTVQAVLAHPNMHVLVDSSPVEIQGDAFVKKILVKNEKTGTVTEVPATGIFVEIGAVPATTFVDGVVTKDAFGHIVVDPKTQRASIAGVWAAGDCSDGLYHQNNIAAGDAIKALEDIFYYLQAKK